MTLLGNLLISRMRTPFWETLTSKVPTESCATVYIVLLLCDQHLWRAMLSLLRVNSIYQNSTYILHFLFINYGYDQRGAANALKRFFNWSVCKILSSNWSIKCFKVFVARL